QSFLPSRSQGGVGHFTHQLANRLATRGHRVAVFSLDPAPAGASYTVVRPAPGTWFLAGRLARVYGFALWLARRDYAGFDVSRAPGDNHLPRSDVRVVRTLSGSALSEARHAPRPLTKAFFASLYPLELLGAARAAEAVGISRGSLAHFPWVRAVI